MYFLEDIIDSLDRHHQRATFEAVAGLGGMPPLSVMSREIKRQKNSWVVSKRNGLPTGYKGIEIHPALKEHVAALKSSRELADWLRNPC